MLYSISGTVVHGKGLGHRHGMPTANLEDAGIDIPFGVYAGIATVGGRSYYCITNVGNRPSVDSSEKVTIESLLLDFAGDIYGRTMRVDLYSYLRPTMRFEGGIEAVRRQLEKDSQAALEYFRKNDIAP